LKAPHRQPEIETGMDSSKTYLPVFPKALSVPLKLLPGVAHNRLFASLLNRAFSDALKQGELDFLEAKTVTIHLTDVGQSYSIMLDKGRFGSGHKVPNMSLRGLLYDFMLLAAHQEDPDTLVFQRRLVMEGDTELGLALKNFLDGLDFESSRLLSTLETFSKNMLPVYRGLFSSSSTR